MDYEVLSEFLNVPVSIQFRQPLAAHGSEEEVELPDGRLVGRAGVIFQTDDRGQPVRPSAELVWQGAITKISQEGILFATQGPLGTHLQMFVQLPDIVAITFVPEHVELKSNTPSPLVS